METLRPAFTLKSSDFRKALDISAPTMNDMFKKAGVDLPPDKGKRAGAKSISPVVVRKILEMRGYRYPSTTKIIAFMICKGGTGKTTSSFFVSQRLASYGAKVLVIDADPQGNLTSAFSLPTYGIELTSETPVLVDVINDDVKINQAIIKVTEFLHLLPSTPMNSTLDGRIREKCKNTSMALKTKIQPLLSDYDYILIDCAPALNLTNTAIISASNVVVLPVNPDNFSMMGLQQTLEEVKTIESDFRISVDAKVMLTRFDAREFTSLRYLAEITEVYKDVLFETVIKTSADVKNVITKHEDLFSYSSSSAKEDYDSLTKEIMGLQNGLRRKVKKSTQAEF